jgi:surface antigen/peptidoglycan hydrolase CwlO-like protein
MKVKRLVVGGSAVLLAFCSIIQFSPAVKADKYDDQIRALQAEIDQYQATSQKLKETSKGLEKELSQLAIEKRVIQGQINIAQVQHDKLQKDIEETQVKINNNKDALGSIIADMYIDDDISPLEMLASSKNVGDYIDKSSYQSSISETLQKTIATIKQLRKDLEKQQADVKRVLGEQELAKKALVDKETERQRLLDQTKNQENTYEQLTQEREKQKGELHKQQQAAIEAAMRRGGSGFNSSVIGDPSKGGYPWEAGCWVNENAWSFGGPNGNGTDPIGYGCRQCVSYTGFKVGQRTGNYPRYWGNANMWPASARAAGYQTGSTPRANSVGIIMSGQFGHSVWVESVNGDGSLIVSQYNYYNAGGPGWGNYSKMRVSAATYDTFIYF